MRAVIIDDSSRIRSELRQSLTRLGWTVVGEGSNGIEALELAEKHKPDLMTLDIIMPEMDGIECYRNLRKLKQPPRCLIISVLAIEPRVMAAYEREILPSHFLKKPVQDKELRDRIEALMSLPPLPLPPDADAVEGEALNVTPPLPSLEEA